MDVAFVAFLDLGLLGDLEVLRGVVLVDLLGDFELDFGLEDARPAILMVRAMACGRMLL